MLTLNDLMTKAIQHFPRWMDIRKRYKISTGGKLLSSVADTVADVQVEINEYINQFFIPYYKDKVDIIPDFIYQTNIGIVDVNELTIIEPEMKITTVIKEFYSSQDLAYYQDGLLFVRTKPEKLIYSINSYEHIAELEQIHVWNAYDEFAAFIDTRRFEGETNKELYNRILAIANKTINSSEAGLKNAIAANLTNIIPDFDINNIILERPTAKNLVKYYDEFETILEHLTGVNKDVMRAKSWDIDKWEHEFATIDYIPHTWDIHLDDEVNGIGDNNDLKPSFINAINSTDVTLSFYNKSLTTVDSYIRDQAVNDVLELSLKKYSDVLNPNKVDYTITASEASEIITKDGSIPIIVELYETIKGSQYRKIDEVIASPSDCYNIDIKESGQLKSGKFYKVRFLPKDKYSTMEIYDCYVKQPDGNIYKDEDGTEYDFLVPNNVFIKNGNHLYNALVKKSLTKLTQFTKHENAVDFGSGIMIDKINKKAKLSTKADDCSGELVKLQYDCELSNVLRQNITMTSFYYNAGSNSYLSDNTGDEKTITIDIEANEFSMRVKQGKCQVVCMINNIQQTLIPVIENGEYVYTTNRYMTPQKMKIIAASTSMSEQTIISDIQYSNFKIIATTENGDLMVNDFDKDSFLMPVQNTNVLNIEMSTSTQYSPVLKKVFIGRELTELNAYETGLIKGADNLSLVINSNCNVELYECNEPFQYCDKEDDKQTVTIDYNTDKKYVANSNDAYIMLDTSKYTNIDTISLTEGTCDIVGTGENQRYFIRLTYGQSVSGITITGSYDQVIAYNTIHELIKNIEPSYEPYIVDNDNPVWVDGYKLYVNNLLKCFVIEDCYGEQKQIKIDVNSFKLKSVDNISKAIIYNMPDTLQSVFSIMSNTKEEKITVGTQHNGTFDNMYIYPKKAKTYVARNEYITYKTKSTDIQIVNTFNNGYIDNTLMVYKITVDNKGHSVLFNNNNDWSVGKKRLTIILKDAKDYNMVNRVITESINLGSTITLKDIYTDVNKEQVELAQYIIDTTDKEYTVSYKYDINDIAYDKAEFIVIKNDGFNKLKYSNIVGIKYIGEEISNNDSSLLSIPEDKYKLNQESGIIEWLDSELINSGKRLYVLYSIKKPVAIKFNLDYLYKKIQYPISAYSKINSYILSNIENSKKLDLLNPLIGDIDVANKITKDYLSSDITYASCSEAGFQVEKDGDILTIKKVADNNTLAVKSGWYYMLGKEYYMFASDQSKNIVNDEFVSMVEVDKFNTDLYLHKKTTNYIKNSKMSLSTLANSHLVKDFEHVSYLQGSSRINSITACESYNNWKTFGMNMSLVKGLNGLGINFAPITTLGYALLDLTDYLLDSTHISYYNPNGLSIYIGEEQLLNSISLTDTINIGTVSEITTKVDNICYTTITKRPGYKYYLIVRGQGVIDDIIVQDSKNVDLTLHSKNISMLNLEIKENIATGIVSRLIPSQAKGNKNNGGEISSTGYIMNASNIDWNITKVQNYTTSSDWYTGWSLDNVDVTQISDTDCTITTGSTPGKIETKPIYVGDPSTIKSIIFKINNIPLSSMQGFTAQLYQASSRNGSYLPCRLQLRNTENLNYSTDINQSYIKLAIDIPSNKVIENVVIYIEHKSTDLSAPSEQIAINGEYITEVLDTHTTAYYKLKDLNIEDVHGDVKIYIRASKEGANNDIWTSWKLIELKDNKVTNDIEFSDYRFFQLKVQLSDKSSKIKIGYFDLEVIR